MVCTAVRLPNSRWRTVSVSLLGGGKGLLAGGTLGADAPCSDEMNMRSGFQVLV